MSRFKNLNILDYTKYKRIHAAFYFVDEYYFKA